MSFADYETSDGRPVEMITFRNGNNEFRYTNANNIVMNGAFEHEPLAYTRTAPSQSKDSDDSQLRIKLSGSNPIPLLYREILQSNITTLTIERFHVNDPDNQVQVFWKGQLGSVTVENGLATILCIPFTQGSDEIPRFTYQGLCNYFLFEGNTCRVIKNNFRYESTITGILTPTQIQVDGLRVKAGELDALVSGSLDSEELDQYWLNGYCLSESGEFRRITNNPAGTGSPLDPDVIQIPFPFVQASAGDTIEVFAGCKRDTDICVRKFDNLVNYGGWPTVPVVNPFTTELPKGTRTTVTSQGFRT
jgi:hypothetical protein